MCAGGDGERTVYDSMNVNWWNHVCYLTTHPKRDRNENNKHKQFKVKRKLALF